MIIANRNLEIHMEQAQCNQVVKIKVIKHNLTKQEQSLQIVIIMIIHTRNEHSDMQANKLNAKYHCMSNTQPIQKLKVIASRI